MQGRRILVTGGTGMIGAAMIRRLVAGGERVALLIRPDSNRVRLEGVDDRLQLLTADIRDADAVRAAVIEAQPSVVYHLASTKFNPPTISARQHMETIILGTVNLLEALQELPGAVRVVAAGSAAEYGSGSDLHEAQRLRPGTNLGAAKASAGLLLAAAARTSTAHTVLLRLFMPYGPWEHPSRLIPQTILSALAGKDLRMTAGLQQRDLIYVDDVIEALLLASTQPVPAGSVFNIGSGSGVPVREVVERILALMGNPVKALMGAVPTRPDEIMEMSADISAARDQLGWAPRVPLDNGLRASIEWFSEHRDLAARLAARAPGSAQEAAGART